MRLLDPLPPKEPSAALVDALSGAESAFERLACESGRLPKSKLLGRLFVRREAVHSSRIGGVQVGLRDLLASEAGLAVDRDPVDLSVVRNYVIALEHGARRVAAASLSREIVCEVHQCSKRGVRGRVPAPAALRYEFIWLPAFGADLYLRVRPQMGAALHDESLAPILRAGAAHADLLLCSPFVDQNERVARLIVPLLLSRKGALPSLLLCLSARFEASIGEYHSHLYGCGRTMFSDARDAWLSYFFAAVAHQSEDALGRVRRIDALLRRWRDQVAGPNSRLPETALDLLAENPFWSTNRLAMRLGVGFSDAQQIVDRLMEAGIFVLEQETGRRRCYCARALLEILDSP